MSYDRIADLSLTVDDVSIDRLEGETTSDFTRVTTEITLAGDGAEGRGEDVTYETEEHDLLAEHGLPDLEGSYTLDSFSERLAEVDLFPAGDPERSVFRNYRRWGFESAALDLALRQAGLSVADALERSADPIRFVASTRLGEPPTVDRLETLRDRVPDVEFKLDPTPEWDDDVVAAVGDAGPVRILDLKGQYSGTQVDVTPDPALYRRLIETFPDAILEDPELTAETRPLFDDPDVRQRVSWDAPIHGRSDVEALPWEPDWLNVKPSRFGSLESLLETIAYCEDHGIRMYGGGQFELGVGRSQLQSIASLYYPETPNDLAPRPYNVPELSEELPTSPLETASGSLGFR